MKKYLILLLSLFLVIGCGQKQDPAVKKAALEAYVEKSNALAQTNGQTFKLEGNVVAPKSGLNNQEVNVNMKMNGLINMKGNFLMKFEMAVNDETNSTGANEKMAMYLDRNYMYINAENQWVKESLPAESKALFDEATTAKVQLLTVADAEKMFDSFKDVKYTEEKSSGVAGYQITCRSDLAGLIKMIQNSANIKEAKDLEAEMGQLKDVMKSFDVEYQTFIPKDKDHNLKILVTIKMNVMSTDVNVGPLTIEIAPSNEKVVIPNAAKNAPEIPDLPLSPSLSLEG